MFFLFHDLSVLLVLRRIPPERWWLCGGGGGGDGGFWGGVLMGSDGMGSVQSDQSLH